MKTRPHLRSVLIGVVFGAAATLSIGAAIAPTDAVFEYKFVHQYRAAGGEVSTQTFEQAINAAAAEGWDVVGYSAQGQNGANVLVRKPKK